MKKQDSILPLESVKNGVICLQKKYTQCTKRRECPPVFLIFHFVKSPSKTSGPHRIHFPHPIRNFPFQKGIIFVTGESSKWNEIFQKIQLNLEAVSISMLKKKLQIVNQEINYLNQVISFFVKNQHQEFFQIILVHNFSQEIVNQLLFH